MVRVFEMKALEDFNIDFKAHFESLLASVESKSLAAAVRYTLNAPGKRLRPIFTLEAARLAGLDSKAAKLCAYSMEFVHQFSLVHDDLPALDNDDFRRGLPTVHKKFDEATALLAGDALLNFAYETFFDIAPLVPANAFHQASKLFSVSIGARGMIGGQSLELETLQSHQPFSIDKLGRIQNLKTTELFQASILTPFLLAGVRPGEEKYEQARRFALAFGFAFQIWDDLEDEAQDQASPDKNMALMLGKNEAIRKALDELDASELSDHFSAAGLLRQKLEQKLS